MKMISRLICIPLTKPLLKIMAIPVINLQHNLLEPDPDLYILVTMSVFPRLYPITSHVNYTTLSLLHIKCTLAINKDSDHSRIPLLAKILNE